MSDSDAEFESADEGDEGKRTASSHRADADVGESENAASSSECCCSDDAKHPSGHDEAKTEVILPTKAEFVWGVSSPEDEAGTREPQPLAEEMMTKSDSESKRRVESEDSQSCGDGAKIASLFDKFANVDDGEASQANTASSWGWGSWGTSLVSKAASSVSTFTSQLGEGIQVLGIPDPQELAKEQHEEELRLREQSLDEPSPEEVTSSDGGGDSSQSRLFSHIYSLSSIIEKTGSTVLTTGLDTLELIGKKTMDVLQEGDPGLKNKMAFFREKKPNLSEVLREAQKSDQPDAVDATRAQKKVNYSVLFDESHGLIHLEALEMLSKENEEKLSALLMQDSFDDEILLHVQEIGEVCKLEDFDDSLGNDDNFSFLDGLQEMASIKPGVKTLRLQKIHDNVMLNFEDFDAELKAESPPDPEDLHHAAIKTLADFTAASMEFLHKIAEHVVLDNTYTDDLTEQICSALKLLCYEVTYVSSKYCEYLNKPAKNEDTSENREIVSSSTTEIYLEASNSITYMQDALQLLAPVLQLTFVKSRPNISRD